MNLDEFNGLANMAYVSCIELLPRSQWMLYGKTKKMGPVLRASLVYG